jgi:hypothetical protein
MGKYENATLLSVCKRDHFHGMSGHTRAPHCSPVRGFPSTYRIRFPFNKTTGSESGRAAYWIHKKKEVFFAAGEEPEPEDHSTLTEALESQLDISGEDDYPCSSLESATEEETISW